MLLNILQCTGQSSKTKNCPSRNVNSAEGEKPCFVMIETKSMKNQRDVSEPSGLSEAKLILYGCESWT